MTLGYSKAFNELAKPGFDPTAAEAALRRERDQESIAKQQAHQRQLSGDAEHTGETAKAVGALRQNAEDAAKADDKERKARTDRAMLLAMLDDQIAALDEQIEWFDRQIAEADVALAAIDELERLHAAGDLDPSNPEHAALMRQAGIDAEDFADDPQGALSRSRDAWTTRRAELVAGRDDARRDRDGLVDRRNRLADPEERAALEREAQEYAASGNLDAADSLSVDLAMQYGDTDTFRAYLSETGRDAQAQADMTAAVSGVDVFSEDAEVDAEAGDVPSYLSFADEIDPEGAANSGDEPLEAEGDDSAPTRDVFRMDVGQSDPAP